MQNFDKEKTLAYIHPSFYDLFVCLFVYLGFYVLLETYYDNFINIIMV